MIQCNKWIFTGAGLQPACDFFSGLEERFSGAKRFFSSPARGYMPSRSTAWFAAYVMLFVLIISPPVLAETATTYFATNAQGTVVARMNANSEVTYEAIYRPYGKRQTVGIQEGPGYTGHFDDPGVGLVYMQARYYDPLSGRFLSLDPNGEGYVYVSDNPINVTDPTGAADCNAACQHMRDRSNSGYDMSGGGIYTGFQGVYVVSGGSASAPGGAGSSSLVAKYKPVISYGHIDLKKNAQIAKSITLWELIQRVRHGHVWDFKDRSKYANFPDKALLAEFGNFHYGYVTAAHGLKLSEALAPAGAYQAFFQKHTIWNTMNFEASTAFLQMAPIMGMLYFGNDRSAALMAGHGIRFGDNPDDVQPIVNGYRYYQEVH